MTMKYFLSGLLIMNSVWIFAQVQEQLSPEERKQLTKITEPVTLYKGFLRSRVSAFYYSFDKNFDPDGNRVTYPSISGNGLGLFIMAQYGITDRLEVEANMVYQSGSVESSYAYQDPYSGNQGTGQYTTNYTGMNDLLITARYQLLQDKPGKPAVVLGLSANLPTGKSAVSNFNEDGDTRNYNAAIAKGEFGLSPELRIRKILYPFSLEFGAGYSFFFGADKVLQPGGSPQKVVSGSEFLIRPQVNFHLNDWVSISNYVDYYQALKDKFEGEDYFGSHNSEYDQWTIRYYPGITFQVKRLRIEQAVQIPLAGRTVTADPTYFFAIDYIF